MHTHQLDHSPNVPHHTYNPSPRACRRILAAKRVGSDGAQTNSQARRPLAPGAARPGFTLDTRRVLGAKNACGEAWEEQNLAERAVCIATARGSDDITRKRRSTVPADTASVYLVIVILVGAPAAARTGLGPARAGRVARDEVVDHLRREVELGRADRDRVHGWRVGSARGAAWSAGRAPSSIFWSEPAVTACFLRSSRPSWGTKRSKSAPRGQCRRTARAGPRGAHRPCTRGRTRRARWRARARRAAGSRRSRSACTRL
jgi:hypothetical protein